MVVVDDDIARVTAVGTALRDTGYAIIWAPASIAGLIAIEDAQPALVLLRWRMPLISGATFLRTLRMGLHCPAPLVALTEHEEDAAMAMKMGAQACIGVPVDLARLVDTVQGILHRHPVILWR